MIEQTCLQCGRTFMIWPHYLTKGRGRFCSQTCYFAHRRATDWHPPVPAKPRPPSKGPRLALVCSVCHKPFEAYPYEAGRKYCSLACRNVGMTNKRAVPCVQCGKPVKTHPSKIKLNKIGIFCSVKCYGDYTSIHQRGVDHPAFENGETPNKYPREFARARKAVLNRDGYKCRLCGATEPILVHHVDENSEHNDESNLVTLCHGCHRGPVHTWRTVTFDKQGNPVQLEAPK